MTNNQQSNQGQGNQQGSQGKKDEQSNNPEGANTPRTSKADTGSSSGGSNR